LLLFAGRYCRTEAIGKEIYSATNGNMRQKPADPESQAGPAKCYAMKLAICDAEPEDFLARRALPGRTFGESEIQPASDDKYNS